MGHGGQKLTFSAIGRFGRLFGLLKPLLHAFSLGDVAIDAQYAEGVATCGTDQAGTAFEQDYLPVFVHRLDLVVRRHVLAGPQALYTLFDAGAVSGGDKLTV